MPRFAANLSTMFTERAFFDRVGAAAAAGFRAVECQFPYEVEAGALKDRLDAAGLQMVLINTPPGDFAAGERGLAGLPGRETEFAAGLEQALAYADTLACPQIHVMAGVQPQGVARDACWQVFKRNLTAAAKRAAAADKLLLLEPINTRDIPGYLLNTPDEAAALIAELGMAAIKLQFDFYHAQIMRGDLAKSIERHLPITAHIQIASVPERHEPDQGEVNYGYLFELLDRLGYTGWIGAEYFPAGVTEDGLGWAMPHGVSPKATHMATGGERV